MDFFGQMDGSRAFAGLEQEIAGLDYLATQPWSSQSMTPQFLGVHAAQADAIASGARVLAGTKKGKKTTKGRKMKTPSTPHVKSSCQEGVHCSTPNCSFLHPVGYIPMCSYGDSCLGPDVCPYRHIDSPKQKQKKQPKQKQQAPPKQKQQLKQQAPPKQKQPLKQQAPPKQKQPLKQQAPPKQKQQLKQQAPPKQKQQLKQQAPPKQNQPPMCRYADRCERADCYFTHPAVDYRSSIKCRNGSECHGKNGRCPFKH